MVVLSPPGTISPSSPSSCFGSRTRDPVVRNTNKDFAATWPMLERISQDLGASQTELVVYLSMAFGNPYGEPHDAARVVEFAKRVGELGVVRISLADTVGAAQPEQIEPVFTAVRDALPRATISLHLHQRPDRWPAVVDAALRAGCRRFDAAKRKQRRHQIDEAHERGDATTGAFRQRLQQLTDGLEIARPRLDFGGSENRPRVVGPLL